MAFSLRSLLQKLQSGVDAIRKPLPPPVVIQPTQKQLASPRVQQAYRQSQPYIQQAQQAYEKAKPLNIIRNAPAELPRFNFAENYKNPVSKFVATIPQEILNTPRDVFAGSLGLGANLADLAYGRKPVNPLRNIGTLGSGFVNAYGIGPAKSLAVQAGKTGLRQLAKRGAIEGAKIGGLGGTFYGLQEGDNTAEQLKNAAKQGIIGAGVGAVAGAAIPAVSEAFKKGKISAGMSVKNVADDALIQEARKYKSAEEFVNAQPTELNYKNLQENEYSIKAYGKDFNEPVEYFRAGQVRKNGDIWLTDNEAGALQYSKAGGGTKVDSYIVQSKNPLIIDTAGGKYANGNIDINKILTKDEIAQGYTNNPDIKKKFIDYAKNNGYDAVQFSDSFPDGEGGMRSLVVWDKNALRTKSQLTDIYNQATAGKAQTLEAGQLPSSTEKPSQLPQPNIKADIPSVSSTTDVPQGESAVNKIIKALKEAKPIRKEQEALYSAERSKRVGRLAGTQKNLKPGEQGYYQQLGQLKGELPKAQFESIRGKITQEDVNELFDTIRNANITPFEKVSAETALMKLISQEGGQVPTYGELNLLREIFPSEFIKAIETNKTLFKKLYEGVVDIANIPRSIMTSVDISAPGRQGVFNIGRKEFWQNLPNAFKYAFSEGTYQDALKEIKSRPSYLKMRQAKIALTDLTGMDQREERFMSNIAEKIPGFGKIIRASGRSYTGFLTKLRADMFDNIYNKAKQAGVGDDALPSLGKFINSATGRGDLGSLGKISKELNSVFFSPRLLASRLNLVNPYYYYKLDPFVRKEALKTLAGFVGISTGILTAASLAGADVVTDPRNSDFAKIKIGNTRYDILGGFQQPLRTAAQIISGKSISSTTGKETTLGEGYRPLTRTEILLRFFKSKEAPITSLISTIWDGVNFLGQPINLPAEIAGRLIPMVLQDAYDLYKETGDIGIIMAVPSLFGIGTQTYGKLEPSLNVTPSGKVNAKGKPVTGLSEDIVNKFFPPKPQAKEEISNTIELLKSGEIDKEAAKERIKQSLLKDAVQKINSNPNKKQVLAPLLVEELKKSLKSDITSVAKDYTLTKEQKKKKIKNLLENFKKTVGTQAKSSPKSNQATGTRNILNSLGPITGLNGSSLWGPGLDIDLQIGTPVPSPIAGTVISSRYNGGFGNQVKIAGIDGREYWLSHLSKRIPAGQNVQAGQIIGLGGNTGNTIPGPGGDGSHLDLTVKQGNQFLPAPTVAKLLKSFA